MRTISNENEEQNEEEEQEIEFVDSEGNVGEVENTRLQKSVNRLIKLSKIDKEKLKGLSLEEQYDRLEFLVENLPKKTKTKKDKNKPVIPLPTNINAPKIGRKVKDDMGGNFWLFETKEWIKSKKV